VFWDLTWFFAVRFPAGVGHGFAVSGRQNFSSSGADGRAKATTKDKAKATAKKTKTNGKCNDNDNDKYGDPSTALLTKCREQLRSG
jgi:hypothetical protein